MQKKKEQVKPIKEYYIAYFDLLGYKNFFKNNPDKTGEFLNTIYVAIQNTKGYLQSVQMSFVGGDIANMSIQTRIFSDNVLLCLERGSSLIEYIRFLAFAAIVADIQRNFILQYDLFLRGGITIGSLSVNDDFVFGQGIIDAVELEESAKYPRIIVGESLINYVLQPHFVKQEDLSRACDIEKRMNAGERILNEESDFCNSIRPNVYMEQFYLQWRSHLFFETFDGVIALNYLYFIGVDDMIDKSIKEQLLELLKVISPSDFQKFGQQNVAHKQRLEEHKIHVIQKIKNFGQYDDLEISAIKEACERENILKKYLWVLSFHNQVCLAYGFQECMIKSGSTCDLRFMKITVEIFEENT